MFCEFKHIEKIKLFKVLPLPKMQRYFVQTFDGNIIKLSKLKYLDSVINPCFKKNVHDKEQVEKMLNACKLADAVKEFIMWYNPQKLSYFSNKINRRDSDRATVDLGNGLLISFKGFNLID